MEDLFAFINEEFEWKDWNETNLPRSEAEWFKLFLPEIKPLIKEKIQEYKDRITAEFEDKKEYKKRYSSWQDRPNLEWLLTACNENITLFQTQKNKLTFLISKSHVKKIGTITDSDIARAKEVPIESLYEGRLRKSGSRLTGRCPFHKEKTASFFIYKEQGSWWCYGCSSGGSVVDYIMKLNSCDFLTAVKLLIKR